MKLDRNINENGQGKYALVKLRELPNFYPVDPALTHVLVPRQALDFGNTPESEFFVMRLKDRYACAALLAYADAIFKDHGDSEFAEEVQRLAMRAAGATKTPD